MLIYSQIISNVIKRSNPKIEKKFNGHTRHYNINLAVVKNKR